MSLYETVRRLVAALFSVFAPPEISGLENFPSEPPYILATNHLSIFDLPLLLIVCPHVIRAFAAEKHGRNPIYGPLLAMMGTILVRRGEVDRQALRGALDVLARGEALGISPEGTRARSTHALQEGKLGAAYLATRADVPIVPVGLTGTEMVKQNLLRLRRTRVRVVVGKSFRLAESGRVRVEKLREYSDLIMHCIAELLPKEYRGVYA
jgi:1-acyl-sn-glycerol-3-phosphate acyltransferase